MATPPRWTPHPLPACSLSEHLCAFRYGGTMRGPEGVVKTRDRGPRDGGSACDPSAADEVGGDPLGGLGDEREELLHDPFHADPEGVRAHGEGGLGPAAGAPQRDGQGADALLDLLVDEGPSVRPGLPDDPAQA